MTENKVHEILAALIERIDKIYTLIDLTNRRINNIDNLIDELGKAFKPPEPPHVE